MTAVERADTVNQARARAAARAPAEGSAPLATQEPDGSVTLNRAAVRKLSRVLPDGVPPQICEDVLAAVGRVPQSRQNDPTAVFRELPGPASALVPLTLRRQVLTACLSVGEVKKREQSALAGFPFVGGGTSNTLALLALGGAAVIGAAGLGQQLWQMRYHSDL